MKIDKYIEALYHDATSLLLKLESIDYLQREDIFNYHLLATNKAKDLQLYLYLLKERIKEVGRHE